MAGASFVNAAVIFGFAVEAYQRIADRHPPERSPDQREAIVAVVFAAAALEAFINELSALAGHPPLATAPDSIKAFAAMIKEVENEQGSVYLKFHVTRWIFAGSVYQRGEEPFQSFRWLVKLRNEILHLELDEFKPIEMMKRDEYPRFIEALRSQNILAETGDATMSWLHRAMTLATARWACNTAVRMVQSVLEILPAGSLRQQASLFFGPARFPPV